MIKMWVVAGELEKVTNCYWTGSVNKINGVYICSARKSGVLFYLQGENFTHLFRTWDKV